MLDESGQVKSSRQVRGRSSRPISLNREPAWFASIVPTEQPRLDPPADEGSEMSRAPVSDLETLRLRSEVNGELNGQEC